MITKDNTAGEDAEVRRAAINALGNHAGTVVVMDPKTGHVYSIVNQEWGVRRGFKPCSTIKLVTGLAGLNEKVIDPNDTASVSGAYHIDLTDALAHSNNTYFQMVGGRVGFDRMISYARQLGLGEKTGINLSNESQGQVPEAKSGYAVNHMSSHGDDFKVTAVQLATLVSAMANGGKLLSPRISPTVQNEAKFKPRVRRLVNLDFNAWAQMVPGMVGAVNYGSGRRAYDPAATVVGKTGTCIEQGTWVGLFASYAPLVNPRLAVVVIARGTDAHGHFPAAVAGRIYRELNARFDTPTNLQLAAKPDGGRSNILNEEDVEETGAELLESGQASLTSTMKVSGNPTSVLTPTSGNAQVVNLPTNRPVNSKVRLVLMPIPKRNEETAKPASKTPLQRVVKTPEQRPRRASNDR
jgi:membrane peptidoglycan carboxypeptidase